ncbi:hypothetical protein COU20_02680 [Candidatus Kaiserbacteria bacterium CG10_big_fil_rev_8_21_14_0_10_59_10]|uniref:Beta-lactamase-related domain-containing protein n=1 Tax=Candidatus Kaiserbacteria bacterium CG10_big_fil_rev_8_21_14_0_10_59_10 TaxID=1974612 RepID=A0A2H0U7M2_9BACT|nr:MAG: hypothetical protein COU20_02680 [Candidatus Kaiserbacteria bacterium CG10_big_fil_rev_8_21_14_0_10_59_10]
MLEAIVRERAARTLAERVFPGCVVGIIKRTGERLVLPFGASLYGAGGEKVREDTIYDVASVTKSIPTASLALMLVAEGKLSLSDAVKRYVPELRNEYGATVEDLLRYRVRGLRMSELKDEPAEEIERQVLARGFDGPPGEPSYTNAPAFLLGLVVERAGGNTLDALARDRLFSTLGMDSTTFFPPDAAPTEIGADGKDVRGIVHDESARVFARVGRAVGHAGLFSNAPDLLNFLEALLQIYRPTRSIVGGAEYGLGWAVNEPFFMGKHATGVACFGKTGFTGCSVVCDAERGIGLVILSNRTYPKRTPDAFSPDSAINVFRRDVADIVWKYEGIT